MERASIILVGMPGAGKSTLGVLLAKELGLDFVDTDVAIQVAEGNTLQRILDQQGYMALRDIEEQVILSTDVGGKVVATGGSAVYGERAMVYLKGHGLVVYVDVPLLELRQRIDNYDTRGIARQPGQSFEALFAERSALYRKYADLHIDAAGLSISDCLRKIIAALAQYHAGLERPINE